MSRRMLINAVKAEELRIAIVDGKTLENYQVEVADRRLSRGNIYRGRIASIQPSLNAAFIDYGAERHGFLAIQDVVSQAYFQPPGGNGRPRIEDVLERGRSIVVQVSKEPEGQKGAALTTNLSLAGRYLVLTPFDSTVGVSRKVEDDDTRKRLREQVGKLDVPEGCGVIVRTNALDQNKSDLNRDLAALSRLWKRVGVEARRGQGTKLIYSDQDLILRALRDFLDRSVTEILIDDDAALEKAQQYLRALSPRTKMKLVRYEERAPLFSRFDLEPQIDRIYQRDVDLPSGGSLVIDRTEALTAIDVNSGRATRGANQEETALNTNMEAAREVGRQLRLRDIGGLLVVDFIDMRSRKNQRKVEKALRDAMKEDKARSTVGKLSLNGLLEINRQRIQQALSLRTHRECPTCSGTGRIASPEMVGLNLLRRIEARAASGSLKGVKVSLHPELADAFQNQRRKEIAALEEEFELQIAVIASSRLHRSDQEIQWRDGEPRVRKVEEPQAIVAAAALATDDLEDGDEDAGTSSRRTSTSTSTSSRRRRTRRPKRRGGSNGSTVAESQPATEVPPKAGAPAEEASEPAAPRKRRRPPARRSRSRRVRKPSEDSAATDAPAANKEKKAEPSAEAVATTAPESAARNGEASPRPRPRRRRSGRRRRRPRTSDSEPTTETGSDSRKEE